MLNELHMLLLIYDTTARFASTMMVYNKRIHAAAANPLLTAIGYSWGVFGACRGQW
jgi:hypothetical protein